jgi:hypothetical protein
VSVVIKIIGLANGQKTDVEGWYLADYTPDGYDGLGDAVMTPRKRQAKRYPTMIDATEHWRSVSKTHPVRRDGKPNRPLTAFTIEIEQVD